MLIDNHNNPLVSIIVPVYNRQEYIQRAVNSVLNQSYEEWELIIVDDGSKDNTPNLIELYKQHSHRIKTIYQTHQRLPAARNNGIRNSTGNFITFLDSDDEFAKDHLKLRINYIKNNPDIDFIHGGVKIIGNEFVPDKDNPDELIHLSKCTIGATFFAKRDVFINLGGFRDIPYSEDSEFLERVIKNYKVAIVNYPTYIYHRETPGSITNSIIGTNNE